MHPTRAVRSPESGLGMGPGKQSRETDLGKGKETLGERDDVLHLSHCIDAVLHGLRVLSPGTLKHVLDA